MSSDVANRTPWTELQGQYLAFLYAYSTSHGRAPAEADLQTFIGVTPPGVHRMVLELESKGFIRRQAGAARSMELLIPPESLPILRRPGPQSQPCNSPVERY